MAIKALVPYAILGVIGVAGAVAGFGSAADATVANPTKPPVAPVAPVAPVVTPTAQPADPNAPVIVHAGLERTVLSTNGGDVFARIALEGRRPESERLARTPFLAVEPVGRGRAVLYNEDPNFRLFWFGLNRLFLNSLFFAGGY